MGLFRKKTQEPPAPTVDPSDLAALRAEMSALQERLDASERSKAALEERVEQLDGRLTDDRTSVGSPTPPPPPTPTPTPTPAPPPPPASLDETPPVGMIRVDDLAARVDELAALLEDGRAADAGSPDDERTGELDALRRQLEAVTNRLDALDLRVTNVSTELANQLTELGNDIEQFARQPEDGEVESLDTAELEARLAERLDVAMEEVHDSTERLANEQARYQIQFREDLAALAERLRRPGPT